MKSNDNTYWSVMGLLPKLSVIAQCDTFAEAADRLGLKHYSLLSRSVVAMEQTLGPLVERDMRGYMTTKLTSTGKKWVSLKDKIDALVVREHHITESKA